LTFGDLLLCMREVGGKKCLLMDGIEGRIESSNSC
jgi:hypothetical protein